MRMRELLHNRNLSHREMCSVDHPAFFKSSFPTEERSTHNFHGVVVTVILIIDEDHTTKGSFTKLIHEDVLVDHEVALKRREREGERERVRRRG